MFIEKFLNKLKSLIKLSNKNYLKPDFIVPSKEECLNLIKLDSLKWNQLKFKNPYWLPNLEEVNFGNTDLFGINLKNCSLVKADLSKTINLHEKNLGGANLDGAKLPEGFEFAGLKTVKELSVNSSSIFITIILVCFYCLLTVFTTNDLYLLTNSSNSTLPIINVSLPIIGFYWAAPFMLLAFYIYFHLNLKKLWNEFSELPAYFPDGKSIDQKSYSWLVNDLVVNYMSLLKNKNRFFLKLQNRLIIILVWGFIPLTIFVIWAKYLINHEMVLSFIHSAMLSVCLTLAIIFYQNIRKTMQYGIDENQKKCNLKCILGILLITLFLTAVINAHTNLGYSYKFDDGTEIVKKPNNWAEIEKKINILKPSPYPFIKDKKNVEELKGQIKRLNFTGRNLRNMKAPGAFLANAILNSVNFKNADLWRVNLEYANLVSADLQYSNLIEADLQYTLSYSANFQHTLLTGTNFQYAYLRNSNFQYARGGYSMVEPPTNFERADLKDANFEYADLVGVIFLKSFLLFTNFKNANLERADFQNAYFGMTNFQNANLREVNFENTDLQYAEFSGVLIDKVTFDKFINQLNKYEYKPLIQCTKEELKIIEHNYYGFLDINNTGILVKKAE